MEKESQLLETVYGDVCSKIEAKPLGEAKYIVTFIDDKSIFVWIYLLKHKEVFRKFIEWKAIVEKSSGKRVRTMAENTLQRLFFKKERYTP